MNRSIKYCPSLPTTFSYLSGNFRIPSQKNDSSLEAIQFWSQFSISAKKDRGDLPNPSEQPVIRRSKHSENTAGAIKHPFERFQIFFYDFNDMKPSVVMKKNNFIMSLLVFRPFFSQCTAQMNKL